MSWLDYISNVLEETSHSLNASSEQTIPMANDQHQDVPPDLVSSVISNSTGFLNSTETDPYKDHVKKIVDILLLVLLVFIMLAMGCEITLKALWGHIKRPIGLSIGIISQFGIKPLVAYGALMLCGINGLSATGVLIIACCPGGVLSNTFTYFSDGDLPLSVAMTTTSTVMAMGMLPANMLLYGKSFESVKLVIPYASMSLSLLLVTSPIVVGMIIKWKLPRVARWVTKIGTYIGLLLMLACVIIEIIIFPDMFTGVPLQLYAIILSLPFIGLVLGYGVAMCFRQGVPVCKTIAIECGIQNFPLALTVIALSFPMEVQEDIVLLPLLYGVSMIVICSVLCIIYAIWKKLSDMKKAKKNDYKNGDDPEKEDLMLPNGVVIQLKPALKKNSINSTNGNCTAEV